jgi:hypothetical protein
MMFDPIKAYDSGQVMRFHANPQMNRRMQTNADHQWGCAIIALSIAPELCTQDFLVHALLHDAGERLSGDLPAPFKVANREISDLHRSVEEELRATLVGNLPELSVQQEWLLKIADVCEALFCILLYVPNPEAVEGWPTAVRVLTGKVHAFDDWEESSRAWDWVEQHLNPLITKRNVRIDGMLQTVTPF